MKHLVLLLLLLVPFTAARAQEEDEPVTLNFYTHPTEHYNVVVPTGWDNQSSSEYAHFVNDDLHAQIYTFVAQASTADAATEQLLAMLFPSAGEVTRLTADEVNLTTGTWAQEIFRLADGTAITAFSQTYNDRTFIVFYVSEAGVIPFVVRIDAPLQDEASAQAVFERAFELLGLDAQQTNDIVVSPPGVEPPLYGGTFSVDAMTYAALARPSSATAADVIIGTEGEVSDAHEAAFMIVRNLFITPETSPYLTLGLVVAFGILLLFIASLIIRRRNLAQDEAALSQLANQH